MSDVGDFGMASGRFAPRGDSRVLLTTVFGPFAGDDEFSRTLHAMEAFHSQITGFQGPFSLRMLHRSWNLLFLAANISAPCTVLDFPTLEGFVEELERVRYDVIGITAVLISAGKVRTMCRLIRKHQPWAAIVVGGHVTSLPRLTDLIDADHFVHGEGVRWLRRFLGERADRPLRHPPMEFAFGVRTMGTALAAPVGNVVVSVGCAMGCPFCSISAKFGGKGRGIEFLESGDELFATLEDLEETMKVQAFHLMADNFLLKKRRALRLLELVERHDKAWSFIVWSSANAVRAYTVEQLVRLGVSCVWVGTESKETPYQKLSRANTIGLVDELRSHGIVVIASSILGLNHHRPDNIDDMIDYAVRHSADFQQFTLMTPLPETPTYEEELAEGNIYFPGGEGYVLNHRDLRLAHRHPHIPPEAGSEYLRRAFRRDLEVNGPSVLRAAETLANAWSHYGDHPDERIRRRHQWIESALERFFVGAAWAAREWYRDDACQSQRADALLTRLCRLLGLSEGACSDAGALILERMIEEDRRLRNGWLYDPPTFRTEVADGHIEPIDVEARAEWPLETAPP